MMGAAAGLLVTADFVTPVKRAMGTTLASTALTAPHRENGPAPLLSWRGVTAVARPPLANSAVHSFDSVPVRSHGNFSALGLRSCVVLPSQQQGPPSSSDSLCSPAVCPIRPVSQPTPINVDSFQHKLSHHPNPDKVAYVQGARPSRGFSPRLQLQYSMKSALQNPQVSDNYLQSKVHAEF